MTPPLLVIGGGIGGMAAALALVRAGREIALFERAPAFGEIGAGMSLWPNATRVLQSWGVLGAVAEAGRAVTRFQLLRADGRVISTLPLDGFATPTLCVHRADLHQALHAALPADILVKNRRLLGFSQEPEAVTARFEGGAIAGGSALIGADGIHSTVRAQLHGGAAPIYRGYQIWRGIGREAPGLVPGQISETWGRGCRFGILPLGRGRVCWYATRNGPEGEGEAPEGRQAEVARLFQSWHAPIPALVESTAADQLIRGNAWDREPLRVWGDRRVTLLGDAAHPITPNLGQGACLAIEDAAALARCVREEPDLPVAFRRYERRRRDRTGFIARRSRQIGAVGQWQNPLLVAGRDWGARLVLACAPDLRRNPIYAYEA